jgi:hypothetical protein
MVGEGLRDVILKESNYPYNVKNAGDRKWVER